MHRHRTPLAKAVFKLMQVGARREMRERVKRTVSGDALGVIIRQSFL